MTEFASHSDPNHRLNPSLSPPLPARRLSCFVPVAQVAFTLPRRQKANGRAGATSSQPHTVQLDRKEEMGWGGASFPEIKHFGVLGSLSVSVSVQLSVSYMYTARAMNSPTPPWPGSGSNYQLKTVIWSPSPCPRVPDSPDCGFTSRQQATSDNLALLLARSND